MNVGELVTSVENHKQLMTLYFELLYQFNIRVTNEDFVYMRN